MRYTNKNKYRGLLPMVLMTVLFTSCTRDLLEPVPQVTISSSVAYTTPEKIQANIYSLYSQVLDASFFGGRFIIFNEQRGDEFSQNDGNNSTGANVWNQTITSSGSFVNAVWSAAYRAINSSNIAIANLTTTSVITEAQRKSYLAEAKFIRAFCYLNLVQTYAKPYTMDKAALALPLRLTAEISGGNNDMVFSSVEAVYTQILKDLTEAEADLPDSYSTALLSVSRARKGSAIALKTRAYLVMGSYANVITEANKIVSPSVPYVYAPGGTATFRLEPGFANIFTGTYTGLEAVFTLPFVNAAEAPGNQSALAYNYNYPILYLNTAAIVSDPVFGATSTDARATLVKPNATGQRLLRKFAKNTTPYTDYIPVVRYAEVLLNYAEAAARTNDLTKSLSLLNAVRQRSDAGFSFPGASVSTQAALISTITTERRIELLGEGFRTMDLFRRGETLPAKSGTAGTASAIAPTAPNYVWGTPSDEISYNKMAPK